MNPGGMGAAQGGPAPSTQPIPQHVPGASAGPVPQHPIPGANLPNHANPTGGKPGSSAHPNQNVLEAVKKVQEEAQKQSQAMDQRSVGAVGRVLGPGVPQQQQQQQPQQQQQGMQPQGMMPGQQQQQQNQQQMGMNRQQQQPQQWGNGPIRPGMQM